MLGRKDQVIKILFIKSRLYKLIIIFNELSQS